ncbi:MAG TPA: tRNA (N6-isopentenyl adenosine(37)-C2)-methylthiotransferase MiaB [bacterium]|jgi:tRNA-2-methylthio-N6-dimethylallyladenosine synthase|nr:tRNA (N6-isopentenyl adenosine(37)-C2)-methylthiotransferase MiaB [bacterium]HNT64826.1 tRNA (N6-isopentenyl adenosine(37)-C2)-methylthiotransferase MiaB [bacterium]
MEKIYIETYGCQMNEYDSEIVKAILGQAEFCFSDSPADADIILLNTCSVRENAVRKVRARIHELRHQRREDPPLIGLLGCMVTSLKEKLLDLPLDLLAGPDSYRLLPMLLQKAHQKRQPLDTLLSRTETYDDIYPVHTHGVNAWIAVMRGCDNFCSFCIVPYARGRERSRPIDSVVQECRRLAEEKFVQITLLGQNVNSYRTNKQNFADLLVAVAQVPGIERIRFTSPHPKDFPEELIRVVAENPRICKHIHLPLQAGDDRILQLMRRTYNQSEYLQLVDKIRKQIPQIVLTTDAIVGFPTETEAEFQQTYRVLQEVEFDSAFIFKYSPRQGTLAAKKYADDVSEQEKTDRIVRLNALQKAVSLRKNQAHIGQIHRVLIEKAGTRKNPRDWQARNDGNKIVVLPPAPLQVGEFIDARILRASAHSLRGELV